VSRPVGWSSSAPDPRRAPPPRGPGPRPGSSCVCGRWASTAGSFRAGGSRTASAGIRRWHATLEGCELEGCRAVPRGTPAWRRRARRSTWNGRRLVARTCRIDVASRPDVRCTGRLPRIPFPSLLHRRVPRSPSYRPSNSSTDPEEGVGSRVRPGTTPISRSRRATNGRAGPVSPCGVASPASGSDVDGHGPLALPREPRCPRGGGVRARSTSLAWRGPVRGPGGSGASPTPPATTGLAPCAGHRCGAEVARDDRVRRGGAPCERARRQRRRGRRDARRPATSAASQAGARSTSDPEAGGAVVRAGRRTGVLADPSMSGRCDVRGQTARSGGQPPGRGPRAP
jgi:hypothetical protein